MSFRFLHLCFEKKKKKKKKKNQQDLSKSEIYVDLLFKQKRIVGTYVEVYQDEGPRLDTLLSAVTVDRSKVDLLFKFVFVC